MSPYVRALRDGADPDRLALPSVGGLVRETAGALLFVQSADDGRWSIPGGTVGMDETPAGAVIRELREETGLIVRPTRVFAVYGGPEFVVRYGDETQYISTMFECEIVSGALRTDGKEITAAGFYTHDAASALLLAPWLVPVLSRLFQPAPATWFGAADNAVGDNP
jgi:ADP-ribose pyrophosphatase YjhB (NUDIX family)